MAIRGRGNLMNKGKETRLVCLRILRLGQMFKESRTEDETEEGRPGLGARRAHLRVPL